MKPINCFYLALFFLCFNQADAQQKKKIEKSLFYPTVVQFHSVCCGVPSDKPLLQFLSAFKKDNNLIKINAVKIAPMGKEGEYYLAFPLKDMNRKQRFLFRNKLSVVVSKMKDKGNATVEDNMNIFKSELPANVKFIKLSY